MATVTKKLSLDVSRKNLLPNVIAKQYDTLDEKGVPVSTNQKGFFYVRDSALKEKITALFEAAKEHI